MKIKIKTPTVTKSVSNLDEIKKLSENSKDTTSTTVTSRIKISKPFLLKSDSYSPANSSRSKIPKNYFNVYWPKELENLN